MKVLMLTGNYPPLGLGGTEVFVSSLVNALRRKSVDAHVVYHLPAGVARSAAEAHVHILPALPQSERATYSFRHVALPGYMELIDALQPDLIHSHSWGVVPSLSHIEASKAANLPVVVTHHVPGMTCMQRSLMYAGDRVCDGEMRVGRCTRCRIRAFTRIPSPMHWIGGHVLAPRSLGRLGEARPNTAEFIASVKTCADMCDRIQVFTNWARDVFLRNGIASQKIDLIRTAIDNAQIDAPTERKAREHGAPLRLVYWGRIDRTKGLHVLVGAIRRLARAPLDLLIVGARGNRAYHDELLAAVGGDPRIRFLYDVPHRDVLGVVSDADLAVFPAIWLETGPLTVLEAQAVGLPILASNLGGIAELCAGDASTRLVDAGDEAALAQAIDDLARRPEAVEAMRTKVRQPRPMRDFADELLNVTYAKALAASQTIVAV